MIQLKNSCTMAEAAGLLCFDGSLNFGDGRESKCLARSDQYQDNSNLRAAAKAASACLSSQLLLQHEHRHTLEQADPARPPPSPSSPSPRCTWCTSSPTARCSSSANACVQSELLATKLIPKLSPPFSLPFRAKRSQRPLPEAVEGATIRKFHDWQQTLAHDRKVR